MIHPCSVTRQKLIKTTLLAHAALPHLWNSQSSWSSEHPPSWGPPAPTLLQPTQEKSLNPSLAAPKGEKQGRPCFRYLFSGLKEQEIWAICFIHCIFLLFINFGKQPLKLFPAPFSHVNHSKVLWGFFFFWKKGKKIKKKRGKKKIAKHSVVRSNFFFIFFSTSFQFSNSVELPFP